MKVRNVRRLTKGFFLCKGVVGGFAITSEVCAVELKGHTVAQANQNGRHITCSIGGLTHAHTHAQTHMHAHRRADKRAHAHARAHTQAHTERSARARAQDLDAWPRAHTHTRSLARSLARFVIRGPGRRREARAS